MTFKVYMPYSQLDIDIADSNGDFLEGFYANLESVKEKIVNGL